MKRIDFLKRAGLGMMTTVALAACKEELTEVAASSEATSAARVDATATCTSTVSETAGPFPTKSPSSLVRTDIRADRTGLSMTITLTIQNKNKSCAALQGVLVDIWHCDKDGYYSEYGGTQMQTVNYTAVHFLRGRQTTNASGQVAFTSIFPGWYKGRAPHIHVSVYNSAGKSLLVTQIAFPKTICDTVYSTAKTYYTKGLQDTTNEKDNVFGDGYTTELATLTGSVAAGYALTHAIVVSA
ncbi:MAG: intradiol ring-cleavage dioxygenase [Spirosomataceae bacterium]